MKRSEINTLMFDADEFFKANKFYLPPFACWKPDDWSLRDLEVEDILKIMQFGVMSTPALIIDGKVAFSGKSPSVTELKEIIGEEIEN